MLGSLSVVPFVACNLLSSSPLLLPGPGRCALFALVLVSATRMQSMGLHLLMLVCLLQRCATEMGELRDYVDGLGGHLPAEGWSLTIKPRTTGTQAGLLHDRTFRAPDGSKYRSKVGGQTLHSQHSAAGHASEFPDRVWPATCREDLLHLPDAVFSTSGQ